MGGRTPCGPDFFAHVLPLSAPHFQTLTNPIKKWCTELNREFSVEEIQMAKRYLRTYLTSLAIRDMHTKTILRYHLIPVRMAKIKNTNDSLCWRGCGTMGALIHCW